MVGQIFSDPREPAKGKEPSKTWQLTSDTSRPWLVVPTKMGKLSGSSKRPTAGVPVVAASGTSDSRKVTSSCRTQPCSSSSSSTPGRDLSGLLGCHQCAAVMSPIHYGIALGTTGTGEPEGPLGSPFGQNTARRTPEVHLGEVRHPEREEPYRTFGAVHPLRRALV